MRRLWIVFTTVAMVLVIALPATAKKPNKPKPPTAVPIALHVDAVPMWVHEGGDNLRYTVTIDNKTSEDIIGPITVTFTVTVKTDSVTDSEVIPTDSEVIPIIPAKGRVTMIDRFAFLVSDSARAMACIAKPEDCGVSASVEIHIGGVLVTEQTMSTPLMPYPPCGFEYGVIGETLLSIEVTVPGESYDVDLCIWTPPRTGVWEITLNPTVDPDKANRPIRATIAVRDGVPGNWCTVGDNEPAVFGGRWRDGDGSIQGQVYLPGNENGQARDGMCLAGGAGGEHFQVGNPDSFYLRANGTVTTEWVSPIPQNR